MGAYPFSQAVKHPEHMCPDCANVIGPVGVFGNNPDDNKCEGAGMDLKPQWGGKLEGQAKDDPTQHAFIDISYDIRDHTDSEKHRKFVISTRRMAVPMCGLGKQLPKVHVLRQLDCDYPDIRKKMDCDGVPRMVDIDGFKYCGHCKCKQTYQGYADYSWRSSAETCTNPECIMNGGEEQ